MAGRGSAGSAGPLVKRNRKIERALRKLRQLFPPLLPVRLKWVRRGEMGGDWSRTILHMEGKRGVRFEVLVPQVMRQYPPDSAVTSWFIDILIHEWAHLRAWKEGPLEDDHDPLTWGIEYARIYQKMVQT